MDSQLVLSKLRFKASLNAIGLNIPILFKENFEKEGINFEYNTENKFDFVLLFICNKYELESWLDKAIQLLKYDHLFWIAFPKVTSKLNQDINRDSLWKLLDPKGFKPVTNIALDTDWSALRFRPFKTNI
jgi:hypothetical protein